MRRDVAIGVMGGLAFGLLLAPLLNTGGPVAVPVAVPVATATPSAWSVSVGMILEKAEALADAYEECWPDCAQFDLQYLQATADGLYWELENHTGDNEHSIGLRDGQECWRIPRRSLAWALDDMRFLRDPAFVAMHLSAAQTIFCEQTGN